jgi:YfiH family protein
VSRGAFASLNLSTKVGDDPLSVETNWSRVQHRIGTGLRVVKMRQVHGNRVAVVGSRQMVVGEADAMITDAPGIALTVLTADCVPILFVAPERRVIGVAHAGWKGTLGGVASATVRQLRQAYNVSPEELYIALGPAIADCCYEVDAEIGAAFAALGADVEAGVCFGAGRPRVDLRRVNAALLLREGVSAAALEQVGPCTGCAADDYFSYRRQAGHTGRQVSVVAWRE